MYEIFTGWQSRFMFVFPVCMCVLCRAALGMPSRRELNDRPTQAVKCNCFSSWCYWLVVIFWWGLDADATQNTFWTDKNPEAAAGMPGNNCWILGLFQWDVTHPATLKWILAKNCCGSQLWLRSTFISIQQSSVSELCPSLSWLTDIGLGRRSIIQAQATAAPDWQL